MAENVFNPLTLDRAEFEQFVNSMAAGTNAPAAAPLATADTAAARGLAPASLNALAEASRSIGQLRTDLISADTRRMGVRDGVFLDISKGAPATVRAKLGLDENRLNQFKMLISTYGPGNVDLSDEGRFILRNQPAKGGGVEDVMVDPVGLDPGDVAQMASQALPIAAGMAGARIGLKGGLGFEGAEALGFGPIGKVAAAVTGMAVGQEGVGGLQDLVVRAARGDDINITEIAKHRLQMAGADEVLGFAFAGTTKAATKTLESVLGLAQIRQGTTPTLEAAKTLRSQTGVKYLMPGNEEAAKQIQFQTGVQFPLTPGQETGAKLLLRLEAMTGERMGSAAALDRIRIAQRAGENELRRVFLGLPRELSDQELAAVLPQADVVGQKGLGRLGTEALRLEGDVAKARQALNVTGTAETQLRSGVTLGSPINATDVGRAARARAVGDFDTFHGSMGQRYEQFLDKPEIQAFTISGSSLAAAVKGIEKKLTPQVQRMKPGPILGPNGQPLPTPTVETLEAFVPSKVRSFIDTLKSLSSDDARVSINSLKQTRTAIRNAVKEGIAIPGTDVTQLRRLEDAVDSAITSSLSKMPNKGLLNEWNQLTSDYAKGMQRFDRVGIREMLVKEGELGAVGNTELAERIVGNSPRALDYYNDFKSFFGAASPEFQAMQDVARQRVVRGAVDNLTGYVSGPALRQRLSDMRPEVAQELFGANQQELHRIDEALSRAQGKLDTGDLMQLASTRSLTASKIIALDAAERARTVAYNNKLIRAAAQGTLDAEKIKPSDFVRYATSMDPDDAAKVMGVLSDRPDLVRDIRQLAIEDIWGRAQAGEVGRKRVSSSLLESAIGNPVQQRTWRTILGKDTVDALESFVQVADPREFGARAFKTAGAIGAGMEAPKLFLRGEVGALPEIASRFVVGFLYSGPLKRAVTNLLTSNDRSRLLNAVISSQPFISALTDRFGGDGALAVMYALRDWVEPLQKRALAVEGKVPTDFDPRTLSREDYRKWLDNQMKQ